MQPAPDVNETNKEIIGFPMLVTVIFHQMTLYATYPCEPLARRISHNFKVILNHPVAGSQQEWIASIQTLLAQWDVISKQHVNNQFYAIKSEIQQVFSPESRSDSIQK